MSHGFFIEAKDFTSSSFFQQANNEKMPMPAEDQERLLNTNGKCMTLLISNQLPQK